MKLYPNDKSNAKRQTPNAKLKLSIFFLLLLGITSTFFTCQKEHLTLEDLELNNENKSSIVKTVSARDIPEVMSFIASKSSDYKFLLDDSTTEEGMNRSHEDNLVITELITDEITQVTNAYQKSNYTFNLIKQSGTDGNYFLNLVVKEYMDTFYLFILKFVPDEIWLSTHSITKDLGYFTGMIYVYSDEGTYVGKVTISNGISMTAERHSCDDEGDDGNGGSTEGSGGGSTGGGGGGSGGWDIYVDFEITDGCWCDGNLVGSHDCSGSGSSTGIITIGGGNNYGNSFSNEVRHPCEGSGSGGATGGSGSCTNVGTCEAPLQFNQDCECKPLEEIENNVVAVNPNPLKDGCIKLNALTNNVDVKQKIASLITSSNNYNYEEGFKIVKYQGQIAAGQIENDNSSNAPDCQAVSTSIHQQVSTFVHSHPVNCNVFGMFSGFDLMVLAQIAKLYNDGDGIASNNYKDPTIMLAYQNTVFALTIDNMQAMNALINIYEDPIKQRKLLKKLNKKFNKSVPNGSQTANIGDLIVDLLNALDDFNLNGLGLYQAEVDNNNMVTSWNRKKLTNNGTNFETENCN